MRAQCIKSGEGFIGVYAVDSPSSFESIRGFYRHIQEVKSEFPKSRLSNISMENIRSSSKDTTRRIPFVLVANKCDLAPNLKVVSTAQGIALANELQCPFIECSARFGMNTTLVFDTVVREVRMKMLRLNRVSRSRYGKSTDQENQTKESPGTVVATAISDDVQPPLLAFDV